MWTEEIIRSGLAARGRSQAQIDAAVARWAEVEALFDGKCQGCGGDATRTLNPDQDTQNNTELPGQWYVYECAACGWKTQRKEE